MAEYCHFGDDSILNKLKWMYFIQLLLVYIKWMQQAKNKNDNKIYAHKKNRKNS